MSFESYARTHYTYIHHRSDVPRDFLDASKMNHIDGDKKDALWSPLRVEFFSEIGMLAGGVIDIAGIAELSSHDSRGFFMLVGGTALMGVGAVIRHSAKRAVDMMLKPPSS